jgi:hypothetical protein
MKQAKKYAGVICGLVWLALWGNLLLDVLGEPRAHPVWALVIVAGLLWGIRGFVMECRKLTADRTLSSFLAACQHICGPDYLRSAGPNYARVLSILDHRMQAGKIGLRFTVGDYKGRAHVEILCAELLGIVGTANKVTEPFEIEVDHISKPTRRRGRELKTDWPAIDDQRSFAANAV